MVCLKHSLPPRDPPSFDLIKNVHHSPQILLLLLTGSIVVRSGWILSSKESRMPVDAVL
jgi:hypothetical protein